MCLQSRAVVCSVRTTLLLLALSVSARVGCAQDLEMTVSGSAVASAVFPPWIIRQEAQPPLSNGYSIQAIAVSTASASLAVSRSASSYTARLDASAFVGTSLASARNDLRFSLRSPLATRVELHLRCAATYAPLWGTVAIATPTFSWTDDSQGGNLDQRIVVDLPANRFVEIELTGNVAPTHSGTGSLRWYLSFTPIPTYPCAATSYGTACGTTLTFGTDFARTGLQRVEIAGNQAPATGLYIVGVQRASVVIGPCTLYNDALISFIAPSGPLYFEAPGIAGFRFFLQGALLSSQGLTATPGYELNCR